MAFSDTKSRILLGVGKFRRYFSSFIEIVAISTPIHGISALANSRHLTSKLFWAGLMTCFAFHLTAGALLRSLSEYGMEIRSMEISAHVEEATLGNLSFCMSFGIDDLSRYLSGMDITVWSRQTGNMSIADFGNASLGYLFANLLVLHNVMQVEGILSNYLQANVSVPDDQLAKQMSKFGAYFSDPNLEKLLPSVAQFQFNISKESSIQVCLVVLGDKPK